MKNYKQAKAISAGKIYNRLKERGMCITCAELPAMEGYVQCNQCREWQKVRQKLNRDDLKREVYAHYGNGKCQCCGETEYTFLTMDHINNDGAQHRRELKYHSATGHGFYVWLRKNNFPEGFQVLCQNCNVGKWRNGGVCPHKSKQVLYAN